jgi:hypothetical protein
MVADRSRVNGPRSRVQDARAAQVPRVTVSNSKTVRFGVVGSGSVACVAWRNARSELFGALLRDEEAEKRSAVRGLYVWLIEPEQMTTSLTSRSIAIEPLRTSEPSGQRGTPLPPTQLQATFSKMINHLKGAPPALKFTPGCQRSRIGLPFTEEGKGVKGPT